MKYLYADSEPFPLGYDFLATLRGFIVCGAQCLDAMADIEAEEARVSEEAEKVERQIVAFDRFSEDLRRAVDAAVHANPQPESVRGVSVQISEQITRTVALSKQHADEALSQVRSSAASRIDARRTVVRKAVEHFLLHQRLEVSRSFFRIRLDDDGYRMFAVCQMPLALEVSYRLEAQALPEWKHPRKIGDLVGEMLIQVGMKKKFLKKDLTREIQNVEDYYIVQADLDAERARVTLRKKLHDEKDTIIFSIDRDEHAISSEIRRPSTKEGDSIFPAASGDLTKLQVLWKTLEQASQRALPHRYDVSSVKLDGEDLFEAQNVVEWLHRYVELYQPTVAEIAKRSPSSKELSLKLEHEDGRREELYLRREDLTDVVATLGDKQMQVFAPLDFFPEVEVEVD
jgi:hypothetical protein